MAHPKTLLIVLDGFGTGKNYPFNAIQNSKMPFYKELCRKFPQSQLLTCGEAVGLPAGVMGNSEVGHTNMGAGRVVYQELTRINKAIRDGEFAQNPAITGLLQKLSKKTDARLHLMGLISDGGVHSHLDHIKALIQMAAPKVPITLHLFTDGRDTPPTSGQNYLADLGDFLRQFGNVAVGTLSGRYYPMDRDQRWDRVEKAYQVLVGETKAQSKSKGNGMGAALEYLRCSYAKEVSDEFVLPALFENGVGRSFIAEDDGILFFNFRADRARQLTRAFTEPGFKEFDAGDRPKLTDFVCLTQYDKKFLLSTAFSPQNLEQILPDVLNAHQLRQFRIAETEKYAHVTFFFNGGREAAYPNEDRVLIPSPKDVATYDLKPEMSAFEVSRELAQALTAGKYDFALVNYANPDMIGHTGNYDAALKALEAVDKCLDQVISAGLSSDYNIFITSDHGNIEEMCDAHGEIHTQHTLNPVPLHYISKAPDQDRVKLDDGVLADLAPTILELMGLPKPAQMTGKSLFKK